MYPRNASSPQRIALGAVVQISDGAVQTSGVSVSVLPQGTTASAGGGTLAFEQGIAHYTPTQAETNYTSFIVIAYKSGCIPASATVVTSASDTAGYAGTDQSKIANATATVNLSGTTIKTATDVETDTADIQSRIPAALVSGRIDASVGAMASGVLTATAIAADAITDAKVASDVTIASVTGAVGSVTGNVGGNVTGSVGSVAAGGITRASFAADTGLQTIRSNTAQAGAAGTITLDASASATDDFYNNTVVYITGGTGVGQARHISDYVGSSKVATIKPNWVTTPDNTSTFAIETETSPWDQVTADHLDSGSTGASLNAAGSAGDPWTTALPGAYGSGTAGFIIGTNLNATVSSRLASASYTAPLDAAGTRSAIGLASANLDAQLDAIPTATENADAMLNRDMSAVSDTNARSPLNALRFLRNKWSISGTTLTVTKENDVSSAWVATVSTDAAAEPVVGSDPS